ncbi:MAG: ABC transporter permease [Streptosporangiaceae bacterium]
MAVTAVAETGARPARAGRRPPVAWAGTLPFLAYVGLFLIVPTGIVIWNAFQVTTTKVVNGIPITSAKHFDPGTFNQLFNAANRGYFVNSIELAGLSALAGATLGAILTYVVATGNPNGVIRRVSVVGSGVLAQFGGVTLAFAFFALLNPSNGLLLHATWYYTFPWSIGLIYLYFQIPLMVLIFLPAVDGLKAQWREAAENLGGSTWHYWRYVGGPLLLPPFLGALLLMFANALSAFATIVAWDNQVSYVVPQQISSDLISEVGLFSVNGADLLALGMVVLVALVMTGYALLQRRTARWLR